VPNVRVIRDDRKDAWLSGAIIDGFQWHLERTQVADIRPLVVLDLSDGDSTPDSVLRCAATALDDRRSGYESEARLIRGWADQIEQQTKPPRIPEPDLGKHVTAGKPDGTRAEFVRVGSRHWSEIGTGSGWDWSDLIDPEAVTS
jgi:hypothetical protein